MRVGARSSHVEGRAGERDAAPRAAAVVVRVLYIGVRPGPGAGLLRPGRRRSHPCDRGNPPSKSSTGESWPRFSARAPQDSRPETRADERRLAPDALPTGTRRRKSTAHLGDASGEKSAPSFRTRSAGLLYRLCTFTSMFKASDIEYRRENGEKQARFARKNSVLTAFRGFVVLKYCCCRRDRYPIPVQRDPPSPKASTVRRRLASGRAPGVRARAPRVAPR